MLFVRAVRLPLRSRASRTREEPVQEELVVSSFKLAFHADVLRGASRVPTPQGTRDEPRRCAKIYSLLIFMMKADSKMHCIISINNNNNNNNNNR